MQSLGKFIASRRKQLGMTQEDLASKVNVSKSAIAKWETDGGIPDRDNLKKLSEVIHVSLDDMHRIINGNNIEYDFDVNITADVIGILESYGFTVSRPKQGE